MKNSSTLNSLIPLLSSWKELSFPAKKLGDSDVKFPAEIWGMKGSLVSFFLKLYLEHRHFLQTNKEQYENKYYDHLEDTVIIVSSQKEADEVETDLNCIFEDTVEVYKLPWWGMLPYRMAGKGSSVFGERASVLARLATKNPRDGVKRVFIVPQRSLLTPVPPVSYERSLVMSIKRGQTLDSMELAERLIGQGYIRVPRVTLRGEFAVRGEVMDIFMPGEEYGSRIVFDFDTVDQIKKFDPETQSSVSGSTSNSLLIYPMKEVVWNEELSLKLDEILKAEDENGIVNDFAIYDSNRRTNGRSNLAAMALSDADLDENNGEQGELGGQTPGIWEHCGQEQGGQTPLRASGEVHLALTEDAKKAKDRLVAELGVNHESEGEELFYGALWDKQYSILDYLRDDATVFCYDYDRLVNAQKLIQNEYDVSYRIQRQKFPVLQPKHMLFDFEKVLESHERRILLRTIDRMEVLSGEESDRDNASVNVTEGTDLVKVKESFMKTKGTDPFDPFESEWTDKGCNSVSETVSIGPNGNTVVKINADPAQSFFGNINYFKEQLAVLQNDSWHIFIFADNENQALRITQVVKEYIEVEDKTLFPVTVIPKALTEGFSVVEEKILVIQENEIFGRRKATPKSIRKAKSKAIDTFIELSPGDFVVHVNYGIGLFKGIERVKAMGTERDYIKLEYADEEFAFVPIEQVNMVQRYIGSETEHPKLDRIGSKSWNARKAKVQQKVEEMAERLIDLYSKRQASRGYAFPKESEWQAAFEAAFPYEDTPDQFSATQDIKADMERPVPMDRLVCGDVGYGKTEIAMRAAFKAVMGGKQVAFLAPTTILAEQHYENCLERFKNFPVTIAQMSRFVSHADQKKILQRLEQGNVDILIGTHRIIQKDVKFKDLGLMIIDEEQRFGVKDKERLKEMKTNIDSLAMSATPIPRTLHMSLLKIRDMSLLITAPQNRQPVETAIEPYNDEKLAMAIRREVNRGGQVFYLHNRVETLEDVRHKIEKLLPEMLVDVAHGQMTSDELDDIFRRFKMGGFHILVATTIIENGIDIPNVNTIIIDRADMYGVSQLYQLRGRVGRSDRKAFAYLFYPENKALSEVAMKRLQVISDFTELGSGFKIAMKDMEIRGAGNLLGKDQSGEVYAVGFDMYLHLLNQAIERLSNSNWHSPDEVLLELEYSGFIPDTYINEPQTKMEVYKRIAAISHDSELEATYDELFDRFGPVPDEVNSLLSLAKIRIICQKLSISSLKERQGHVNVEFSEVAKVNVDKVLKLIQRNKGTVKLNAAKPNVLILETGKLDLKTKTDFIKEKLEQLA